MLFHATEDSSISYYKLFLHISNVCTIFSNVYKQDQDPLVQGNMSDEKCIEALISQSSFFVSWSLLPQQIWSKFVNHKSSSTVATGKTQQQSWQQINIAFSVTIHKEYDANIFRGHKMPKKCGKDEKKNEEKERKEEKKKNMKKSG